MEKNIELTCSCGKTLHVPRWRTGQRGKCSHCKESIRVPSLCAQIEGAPPPTASAKPRAFGGKAVFAVISAVLCCAVGAAYLCGNIERFWNAGPSAQDAPGKAEVEDAQSQVSQVSPTQPKVEDPESAKWREEFRTFAGEDFAKSIRERDFGGLRGQIAGLLARKPAVDGLADEERGLNKFRKDLDLFQNLFLLCRPTVQNYREKKILFSCGGAQYTESLNRGEMPEALARIFREKEGEFPARPAVRKAGAETWLIEDAQRAYWIRQEGKFLKVASQEKLTAELAGGRQVSGCVVQVGDSDFSLRGSESAAIPWTQLSAGSIAKLLPPEHQGNPPVLYYLGWLAFCEGDRETCRTALEKASRSGFEPAGQLLRKFGLSEGD